MKDKFLNIVATERVKSLRMKTMGAERYLSVEQAAIITRVYKETESLPVIKRRALSLATALNEMTITIDPEELIVGNRTKGIRDGVVFPEAGISWLEKEIDTIDKRPQDPFYTRAADIDTFRNVIVPYWKGKTLEDDIYNEAGPELTALEKVVKINQKDHAQGHICPDVAEWLKLGPSGLAEKARKMMGNCSPEQEVFYESLIITLEAASRFFRRYSDLAMAMSAELKNRDSESAARLKKTSDICLSLAGNPPSSFHEALQSVWMLFVILHMESNASSFSPGRLDQYLAPYYIEDISSGNLTAEEALELMDSLFIKFNQIVYMRNSHSAMYFAGFPIGFNVTIGGCDSDGADLTNELSFLILKAQDHVRLPQPNLTARLHPGTRDDFISECTRIISLGTGMPQVVNDSSIIPALERSGLTHADAADYALVGCVELSGSGNYLGWSDAAMFNMVKVLELTLNNGICMLTGRQTGLPCGYLTDYETYGDLEAAYDKQTDHFVERMYRMCELVERKHQAHLPSPFLSSVVNDCIARGTDVTAGGAEYNLSGIQAIQVANIADSLAALRLLVYENKSVNRQKLLEALRNNFKGSEILRQRLIGAPKYGNDIPVVDEAGAKWALKFAEKLEGRKNFRGGKYHMGLYTVSAHVPMGKNVGATPDGRYAGTFLADGGVSPMSGRDHLGPTAVLNSVARLPFEHAVNGTLLNMKFLPSFFRTETDRRNFSALLKSFVRLKIHHVQFNVVNREDLIRARTEPELYRGLTIRVAGYTAYFTELAGDLQEEIIERTIQGG